MMPTMAHGRHILLRKLKLVEFSETSKFDKVEINNIGIVQAGAYQYAKEALGDTVSYLNLGL